MAVRGLRARINQKCRDCIYDGENGGTWREQVYLCTIQGCPLWDIRPMPSVGGCKRAERMAAEEA